MNIKEAIELNNKYGRGKMPVDEAKQFWKVMQHNVSDSALPLSTFFCIKSVESIVKLDAARKFIEPENDTFFIETVTGEPVAGKKICPWSTWVTIVREASNTCKFAFTYDDHKTRLTTVINSDGFTIKDGKGWKAVRDFFKTEAGVTQAISEKKAPVAVVEEVTEAEAKAVKEILDSKKPELPEQECTWDIPEVLTELVS